VLPLLGCAAVMCVGVLLAGRAAMSAAIAPGGFVEKAGAQTFRARFSKAQIDAFMPAGGARGAFSFPAPYNTAGMKASI
jgi:hypothetical protein